MRYGFGPFPAEVLSENFRVLLHSGEDFFGRGGMASRTLNQKSGDLVLILYNWVDFLLLHK